MILQAAALLLLHFSLSFLSLDSLLLWSTWLVASLFWLVMMLLLKQCKRNSSSLSEANTTHVRNIH
jgi:hypothetical protein